VPAHNVGVELQLRWGRQRASQMLLGLGRQMRLVRQAQPSDHASPCFILPGQVSQALTIKLLLPACHCRLLGC